MSAVADDPRIADLERRLALDPFSIAFAQLAEEYRRAGRLDAAIRLCRAGLARYPSYASARVTLARTLLARGEHDQARAELDILTRDAPENIAAKRAVDEWRRLTGISDPGIRERRALPDLEAWLEAIRVDRSRRASERSPAETARS